MTLAIAGSASGGYTINKSLRLRSSATAYLTRTPSVAGNQKTWTWSGWVKRGAIGNGSGLYCIFGGTSSTANSYNTFRFQSSDVLDIQQYVAGVGTDFALTTTQVFRDPSAWYHLVFAYDSTQATASNRIKVYVNGSQITSFSTSTYPALNTNSYINNTTAFNIGRTTYNGTTDQPFDGYLAEVNFIDGQALTPSSFGSTNATTGVWQPAKYTGTYGTNGFYLPFTNTTSTTTLGYDFSGNGNNWTTNNISLTAGSTYDSMNDTPSLLNSTTANYAVMNPLSNTVGGVTAVLTDGNLKGAVPGGSGNAWAAATIKYPNTGKFYMESTFVAGPMGGWIGVRDEATTPSYYLIYSPNGNISNTSGVVTTVATYTVGDIVSIAVDCSTGGVIFYKNNVQVYSGTTTVAGSLLTFNVPNTMVTVVNFGQQPFTYTPPSGYLPLNTYNLPNSTIPAGNKVMDATLWTGTGSAMTITNSGAFKPDLVWAKARSFSSGGVGHMLADSVRGGTKVLHSDQTAAEQTNLYGAINTFNSNGFTTVDGSSNSAETNYLNFTYVGWQWQAGQGTTSTNTNGSITSTVSVNPTAGFSIVSYTGTGANATVGHGLGVAPQFMLFKNRSSAGSWECYHVSLGATQTIRLNSTAAAITSSTQFNNTAPTSTVFSLGSDNNANGSGNSEIAYCWAPIAGFSAFGSYTGNASTNGPFIYLGFRPKWLLIKVSSGTTNNWLLEDTSRTNRNVMGAYLFPNLSDAEGTNVYADFLSNGFKIRDNGPSYNGSGYTYIYAAFAENPFKNALAR